MAKSLGYKFSKADIDAVYYPKGHGAVENDQLQVLSGLARVLKGDALAVRVIEGSGGTGTAGSSQS